MLMIGSFGLCIRSRLHLGLEMIGVCYISLNAEDEFQRRHANLVVRLKFRESTALAADAVLILLGVG